MDSADPNTEPLPEGGWSEGLTTLDRAMVVPPVESAFIQAAGVLHETGEYCPEGALWRKYRPLTTEPAAPVVPLEELSGRWLWGGVLWAHFGHFLVESTARLWALGEDELPFDGVLFVPKRPDVGDALRGFQTDFVDMMAPGLPIRVATAPTRVEQLVVPGQGFGLGLITAGTDKFRGAIHQKFAADIKADGPEKIYISRSALGLAKGGLLGEELLEDYLRQEGYEIFHPEQHDLKTQIARYKAARKVIAADGSALHLYAMVGRPDQPVAMILRRKSGPNNLLARNVECFCGVEPLVIHALRSEFVKAGKQRSNRQSFGELHHTKIGNELSAAGFVSKGADWPVLTEEDRKALLIDKGLHGNDSFVEAPEYVRERVREIRKARRAARSG